MWGLSDHLCNNKVPFFDWWTFIQDGYCVFRVSNDSEREDDFLHKSKGHFAITNLLFSEHQHASVTFTSRSIFSYIQIKFNLPFYIYALYMYTIYKICLYLNPGRAAEMLMQKKGHIIQQASCQVILLYKLISISGSMFCTVWMCHLYKLISPHSHDTSVTFIRDYIIQVSLSPYRFHWPLWFL